MRTAARTAITAGTLTVVRVADPPTRRFASLLASPPRSTWEGFGTMNKSTVDMTVRMLGRTKGIEEGGWKGRLDAVAVAAGISLMTAIVEETIFRGQVRQGEERSDELAASI